MTVEVLIVVLIAILVFNVFAFYVHTRLERIERKQELHEFGINGMKPEAFINAHETPEPVVLDSFQGDPLYDLKRYEQNAPKLENEQGDVLSSLLDLDEAM